MAGICGQPLPVLPGRRRGPVPLSADRFRHRPAWPGAGLLLVLLAMLLLAGCASRGKPVPTPDPGPGTPGATAAGPDPCAVVYEHSDADYTPGGLYRPGQADHAPGGQPDWQRMPQPVPRPEPASAYGNRSPYTVLGRSYHVLSDARGYRERGLASWYGAKFHGRATSSMEPYDMCAFSAAHKTLPLPSYARVTHLGNGRSVIVRINDRGPFHEGRVIDLSYVAALALGVYQTGTAMVEVEAIVPSGPVPVTTVAATTPAPAGAHGPVADGGVYVQVGAFNNAGNARSLHRQLRRDGEPARIERVYNRGRRLYRVRLGPFPATALAEAARERVRRAGFPAATIVIGD